MANESDCYVCIAVRNMNEFAPDATFCTLLAMTREVPPIVPLENHLCNTHAHKIDTARNVIRSARILDHDAAARAALPMSITYCMHGRRCEFRMLASGTLTYRRGCGDCGDIG